MLSDKKSPYLTQFLIAIFFSIFAFFQIYHKQTLQHTFDNTMKNAYVTNQELLTYLTFKDTYVDVPFSEKEMNLLYYEFMTQYNTNSNSHLNNNTFFLTLFSPYLNVRVFNTATLHSKNNENFDNDFILFNNAATKFSQIYNTTIKYNHNRTTDFKIHFKISQNNKQTESLMEKSSLSSFTQWSAFFKNKELFSLYLQLTNSKEEKSFEVFRKLAPSDVQSWWDTNYSKDFGKQIPPVLQYLKTPTLEFEQENLKYWSQQSTLKKQ